MRLLPRAGLMTLLIAAPLAAPAAMLTLSIDGIALTGLGSCLHAPSGCTDPGLPPGHNGNGDFDQVSLTATSTNIDSSTVSATMAQPYVFAPGDTGAGSTDFDEIFSLNRNVRVSYGGQNITQTLVQSGDILVGEIADKLTIHASAPLVFDLSALGLAGTLTLTLGSTSVTAGIDPEGTVPGQIDVNPIPAPPTLALFAAGLAAIGRRRGPRA